MATGRFLPRGPGLWRALVVALCLSQSATAWALVRIADDDTANEARSVAEFAESSASTVASDLEDLRDDLDELREGVGGLFGSQLDINASVNEQLDRLDRRLENLAVGLGVLLFPR